ncbi:hypothetical protein [Desulfobulbus japonicus]
MLYLKSWKADGYREHMFKPLGHREGCRPVILHEPESLPDYTARLFPELPTGILCIVQAIAGQATERLSNTVKIRP